MSDEELAAELAPGNPAEGAALVAALTPNKRVIMVLLIEKAREVELYATGLGPKPEGVIVLRPRRRPNRASPLWRPAWAREQGGRHE